MKHPRSLAGALPDVLVFRLETEAPDPRGDDRDPRDDRVVSGRLDRGRSTDPPRDRRRTPSRASRVVHPDTDAVVVDPPRVPSARVPPRVVRPAQPRPGQKQSRSSVQVTQSSSAATSLTHRSCATWPPTARPARFSATRESRRLRGAGARRRPPTRRATAPSRGRRGASRRARRIRCRPSPAPEPESTRAPSRRAPSEAASSPPGGARPPPSRRRRRRPTPRAWRERTA